VSSVSSVLLARRFFSAREDFLCRHTCLVAALPRCGLPSPCPPPPCPPHPQSQPCPNLFPLPFQPLANSPFPLLLLPSCILKVKGAADALVGARTADGASPGQQRRRPQPLPSPDGGELRSLKPAAGGEQAGGGLLIKEKKRQPKTATSAIRSQRAAKTAEKIQSTITPNPQCPPQCRGGSHPKPKLCAAMAYTSSLRPYYAHRGRFVRQSFRPALRPRPGAGGLIRPAGP